jgi:flavin-dependent dehydrogenase
MNADVAIVGGGPAGLALAIETARRGLQTLVLERHTLPQDKACGEGLMPAGLRVLEGLGVRALLSPADCAVIEGIRYLQEDGTRVEGRLPHGGGLGIRRVALSEALARRAREEGATLLERCAVSGLSRDGEGVTLATARGEARAKVVIAADGLHSPLRAAMGLDVPGPARGQRRYGLRRHFRLRPWTDFVEVHYADGVEAYVTPAGAQRVGIAFLWDDGRLDGRIGFEPLLARFPTLAERLRGAPFDSETRGAGPLEHGVRARTLDRFALLGDAAGYVDAITGEGLSLAFVAARELGRLLPEALSHGATVASLRPYERLCAREFRRYEWLTRAVLGVARRPRLRRHALRLLARSPGLFGWSLGWLMGGESARPALAPGVSG